MFLNKYLLPYILPIGLILIGFSLLILNDLYWLTLFPVAFMLMYFAVFETDKIFLSIAFFTPLSINIEEFSESFGLFIPSEPLLFGLMVFLCALQLHRPFLNTAYLKHPIMLVMYAYLLWMFFTCLTSSSLIISLKYLIARLWIIIPMLFFGPYFLSDIRKKKLFLWMFTVATSIAILYTLIHHAKYQFAEKPSHWVMFPFFKDHTIYGAIVALVLPFVVGLYYLEKRNLLLRATLICLFIIIVLGLIFSYTRAAWLSVFAGILLCLLVFFRVKLYLMAGGLVVALLIVTMNWNTIQMELERNKKEHTTENIDERLQSATNVSTDASNLERINRWDCAITMFKERPLVGFGPGTYMFEYARFQDPENLTIISTNFGNLGNAHSEYLGALSEMGLPGALLFLILVLTIFVVNIQLIYKWPKEDKANRILLMTFLFSFTTYFSHAFLNNYLDTDKAAVPIWGMSAMLIAMSFQWKENLLSSKPE